MPSFRLTMTALLLMLAAIIVMPVGEATTPLDFFRVVLTFGLSFAAAFYCIKALRSC